MFQDNPAAPKSTSHRARKTGQPTAGPGYPFARLRGPAMGSLALVRMRMALSAKLSRMLLTWRFFFGGAASFAGGAVSRTASRVCHEDRR